jgi:hypothetical protein
MSPFFEVFSGSKVQKEKLSGKFRLLLKHCFCRRRHR